MVEHKESKRRRIWPLVIVALFVIVVAVIAILPTLVSWGLGHGSIRKAMSGSINGEVKFASLRTGWFGNQSIEGLQVLHADGTEAANVNVSVRSGLLQIITQRPGALDVVVSGTVTGEIREDGSISFKDLAKPAGPGAPPSPPKPDEPFRLPSIPKTNVEIAGLTLNLTNVKTKQELVIDQLKGTVSYTDNAQPLVMDLSGATKTNGVPGTIRIHGKANDVFAEDGSLTLVGASVDLDAAIESMPLPVKVAGIDAPAHIQSLKVEIVSDDLTDRIAVTTEANVQIEGHAASTATLNAVVTDIVSPTGAIALDGATANVTVDAQNLPFAADDVQGLLRQLRATVVSNDLTKTIVIAVDSQADIEGHNTSMLTASVSVDELLASDGTVTFGLEKITGTLQGTTIPTALVQPMLANMPIVVSRDLGPVVDINASFSAGVEKEITLAATSASGASLEAKAMANTADVEGNGVRGTHLFATLPAVHPDLVRGFTNLAIDQPASVSLQLTEFFIPPTKSFSLQDVSATGELHVQGPVTLELPGTADGEAAKQVMIDGALVTFGSPGLGQFVNVAGATKIDGSNVSFDYRVTDLFDANANVDAINAKPVGQLTVVAMPASTLEKFAPEQKQLIDEVIGNSVDANVVTAVRDSNIVATVHAKSVAMDATIAATRLSNALQVDSGVISLAVSPGLAAALQKASEKPIALERASNVTIRLEPTTLPATGAFAYSMPAEPVRLSYEVPQLVASNVPTVAESVSLKNLAGTVIASKTDTGWSANTAGNLNVHRPAANGVSVAAGQYQVQAVSAGDVMNIQGEIDLSQVSVVHLEQLLGKERGALSHWVGDDGSLTAEFTGVGGRYQGQVHSQLAKFKGDFTAKVDEQFITLTGNTEEFIVSKQVLEQRMNAKPAAASTAAAVAPRRNAAPDSEQDQRVRVLDDVPLVLDFRDIKLPLDMFSENGFDPKTVAIDVAISGGPIRMVSPGNVQTTLNNVNMTLNSTDLASGVKLSLRSGAEAIVPEEPASAPAGAVGAPAEKSDDAVVGAPRAGSLEVTGQIVNLLEPTADGLSRIQPSKATLQLNAKAQDIPTAVADAVSHMEGLLVAAVGPLMHATIEANDFSFNSGSLDGRIETTNGWLDVLVEGAKGTLSIPTSHPLTAELEISRPLRERLLANIHPIFADIRTTEQPLRVRLPMATLAMLESGTFDISQLNADIEITLGKVEFDSGSSTLLLLRLVGQAEKRATMPGEIEPIIARIRAGVVTYDRFNVRIDKWTMAYSGSINLVEKTIDLRTELPLVALAHTFKELEGIADKITVPIITRGKLGEAKPRADFGDVVKQGIEAGLGDILRGGGLFDR